MSPLATIAVPAVCAAALSAGHRPGVTLYVSKLGDDSDGSSWARAFRTVQAALDAIPDDKGGHRVIIRPDTYMEPNLAPAHPGAAGAYNELIGDVNGVHGGGRKGWVVLDSGDPGMRGFKSYDWWGTVRAYSKGWSAEHTDPTFSAIVWDRWRLTGLYVSGGDGGLMFDCTDHVEPFSVVVEDCVSLGRAFGGGVASCLSRPEEPITYRRCHLYALDWWGDTAAAYVRVENTSMPPQPDVVFEDCTMVSPQCALKASNYGFHTFSHVKVTRCRLIALNFSQPQGTPTDGIIQSVQEGKLLQVDLEDSTLMGFKVFGVTVQKATAGDIGYTTKGDVRAYVQYTQDVPAGMLRLAHWPTDVFAHLAPPVVDAEPVLQDTELVRRDMCELAPFVWQGRLMHLECVRPASGGTKTDYCLVIRDTETGEEQARLAEGYSLASILAHRGRAYVFASRFEPDGWRNVTLFHSADLRAWQTKVVIEGENEGIFNTSVCRGRDGFVMAYESNDPAYPPFTVKFARSDDLLTWTKLPQAILGADRYAACPCLRYVGGYYYVLYLEHRTPRWVFETYIARSKDLVRWELSGANPVLRAEGLDEGINASDPELVEVRGETWVYYAVGDQLTWMNIKRARFPGSLRAFCDHWFGEPGIPDADSTAP